MNLLIVSDDPVVKKTISLLLEEEYKIMHVSSYDSVIKIMGKHNIDVIALDIDYDADKDVFDVLKYIKIVDPYIPVIMLATEGDVIRVIKAIRLGASDYILKTGKDSAQALMLSINVALKNKETAHNGNGVNKFDKEIFLNHAKMRDNVFSLSYEEYVQYVEKLVLEHIEGEESNIRSSMKN
ncbi:MAG: response regulator [Proteobacteria bacterium]|nr:response regulator [Pseudomonadota bacterium]